jgi:mRNA interferase MazF
MTQYTPRKGDFVHLSFSPQEGHEFAGPHYGLVISADIFSVATGLAMVCPITSKTDKVSGFQVTVPPGSYKVRGVVLSSEVRTVDYGARGMTFEGKAPNALVETVVHNICQIITN